MDELEYIVRRALINNPEAKKDDQILMALVWAVEWDDKKKDTTQEFFVALSRKEVSTVIEILEARQNIINELN